MTLAERIKRLNAELDAHYEGGEPECPNCFPERNKYCADHMGDIIDHAYESERDRQMMRAYERTR